MVIVAHADDEIIGLGARLPRLFRSASTLPVFVHVTDGSPRDLSDAHQHGFETREQYATARRNELKEALKLAGSNLNPTLCELNIVDQETVANLMRVIRQICAVIMENPVDAIITHPYEGGHPDHDATAFAAHAVLRVMEREGKFSPPRLFEMTSYHNSPNGIEPACFINEGPNTVTLTLTDEERKFKQNLLNCFKTQQATLQYFPPTVEKFRVAPRYDFSRPPHEGTLFYENFGWGGFTGPEVCKRMVDAQRELGLGDGPI
jgi:LmbE family N-acetylglucosaminyl deacetylase